jgi:RNA polymerase sigma-70 factor, ECF subfamily
VSEAPPLAARLEAARPYLWALAYRLTGCAADADEIAQETLARALERPPAGGLRPWLTRVAVNLGRDELRRRRRGYVGEWLPSPVPSDEPPSVEPIELSPGAEARYSLSSASASPSAQPPPTSGASSSAGRSRCRFAALR